MSKFDIRSQFECQHKISNVKISHSARVGMSKDFESQILIFGPNSNVKLGILFFLKAISSTKHRHHFHRLTENELSIFGFQISYCL